MTGKDNATGMDKQHPLSPENQERHGLNDNSLVGMIKNWNANRKDTVRHYKEQESNLAGFTASGLSDEDFYAEQQGNREEIAAGRKMIQTSDGQSFPFTREAVAAKIAEGYEIVNVNFQGQRTAQQYSYLTKKGMSRGGTAVAPFTYSANFNTALADKSGMANVIIRSINKSLKNIMGRSAELESRGVNLKMIGGGGYIGSDSTLAKTSFGMEFGGGRIWGQRGEAISAGMKASKQGGQNATQVIS